jgi:hypothetical protein
MNATWHGWKAGFETAGTVATDRSWNITSVIRGRAEATRLAKLMIPEKPNSRCHMYRSTANKVP